MNKRLLLSSNSTVYSKGYLDHCIEDMTDFLGNVHSLLFIPYALADQDSYAATVKERFSSVNIAVTSLHQASNPKEAVNTAQAFFIGGGNTFRLLNRLYKEDIISLIRQKVEQGSPYMGSSAGSNMACPTIKTTNDMPIVYPPTFDALNLIPFQINPHYIDANPDKHMGETRAQRIKEFHEENDMPVIGLAEGTWLRIENNHIALKGNGSVKIFIKGKEPTDYTSSHNMDFLLS